MWRAFFDSPFFLPLFVVLLALGTEIGFRIYLHGLRRFGGIEYRHGRIETALVGLLSFLLGFNVTAGASVVRERVEFGDDVSEAVIEAWHVASLVPSEDRALLRQELLRYIDVEMRWDQILADGGDRPVAEVLSVVDALWDHSARIARIHPEASPLLGAVSRLASLHTRHNRLSTERLPGTLVALLVLLSLLVSIAVGFVTPTHARRVFVGPIAFVVAIGLCMWAIRDLDDPYGGAIRFELRTLDAVRRGLQGMPIDE